MTTNWHVYYVSTFLTFVFSSSASGKWQMRVTLTSRHLKHASIDHLLWKFEKNLLCNTKLIPKRLCTVRPMISDHCTIQTYCTILYSSWSVVIVVANLFRATRQTTTIIHKSDTLHGEFVMCVVRISFKVTTSSLLRNLHSWRVYIGRFCLVFRRRQKTHLSCRLSCFFWPNWLKCHFWRMILHELWLMDSLISLDHMCLFEAATHVSITQSSTPLNH